MSEQQRSIAPYQGRVPAGQVMTPAGPAVIQVIDMPTGLGPVGGSGGGAPPAGARRPGGINIMGAVLRRWWLVLLVTAIVGGGAVYAGSQMKLAFEGRAKISWQDNSPAGGNTGSVVAIAERVLNSKDIPLIAARDPELQNLFPDILKDRDLSRPAVQLDVINRLKEKCDVACEETKLGVPVIDLFANANTENEARVITNVYSRAFIEYLKQASTLGNEDAYRALKNEVDEDVKLLAQLQKNKGELQVKYNSFNSDATLAATQNLITELTQKQTNARIDFAAAQAAYEALKAGGQRTPALELERLKMIDDEKNKDSVLKALVDQQMGGIAELAEQRAFAKTDEHPDVVNARAAVERAKGEVQAREKEIADVIERKIARTFELQQAKTADEARAAMEKSAKLVETYKGQLAQLGEDARRAGMVKLQIDELIRQAEQVGKRHEKNFEALSDMEAQRRLPAAAKLKIEEWAVAHLKEDKRIKVQAGGMVGGLFLGILLALLIDKFDKRLRDPRDIEPLIGSPLLGTIPRIQELKRVKGEQARNLIAEEFRIIRTQVLFGNPQLNHKVIAITSPQPGDGKTSLAVNLAISIAKAGRRVLLIDGDLRKPDVHRVFNIPDSPGLAELLQGSHEPGAAIRKSEIDGLEILPAGTPIIRPSELLSRPEVGRLLTALGELYDHIILDTAPLLPVSDTHVLAGQVDAVICSFNAEVDRDTVGLTQEILRRTRANVIGSVMNQVKYRQSGSYHRGKTAYDSYYNSPRVPKGGAAAGAIKPAPAAAADLAEIDKP